jgi:hypothetical protein
MSSFVFLAIGAYIVISAYHLGLGALRKPGPGFIFFLAGLVLLLLSALDLLTVFIRSKGKPPNPKKIDSGVRKKNVIVVLVALFLYIYFYDSAGFFLSTFLLILFLFKAIDPTRWWVAAAGASSPPLFPLPHLQSMVVGPTSDGFWDFLRNEQWTS